jgi:DNA-binding GntR family transcriptional regulator
VSLPVLPPLPATQGSLADQVAAAIRDGVRTGALQPGTLYSGYQLADDLGVSRSPVREALLRLAETGMVVLERNRGFRVSRPNPREVVEVFHLRLLLEPPMVRRAARNPTPELAEAMHTLLAAMSAASEVGDEPTFMVHDQKLHDVILVAAGNQRLATMVAGLRDLTRLLGASTVGHSRDLAAVTDEHRPIIDAILAGDGASAERLMYDHLAHTARLLCAQEVTAAGGDEADVARLWDEIVGAGAGDAPSGRASVVP